MIFRPNSLLQKLKSGQACRGAWLFLGSPDATEVMGLAGFDALVIDHEHSPGGLETAIHQMRAIRAAGNATILARVGENNVAEIKRLLDAGVEGLLLPNVESAEDAHRFVAACQYPPAGIRGAHFTVSRAAAWGSAGDEYYRNIDQQLLLVAMIESKKGADAIAEIAAVEGLHMLFIGPLDLTGSVGKMGQYRDEEVAALMKKAEQGALASGKLLGGAMVPGERASDCFARGFRFVTVGSDVGLLRAGAASALLGA